MATFLSTQHVDDPRLGGAIYPQVLRKHAYVLQSHKVNFNILRTTYSYKT